jgi:hypothetical protein
MGALRDDATFANARTVRRFFEAAQQHQAERLVAGNLLGDTHAIHMISAEDLMATRREFSRA